MHIIRQLEAIKLFNLKTTKLVNVKWSKVSLFQRNVIICDRNIVQFPPHILGTITLTKMDQFSENFQMASPPALISENYVALFLGGAKICNKFLDRRDPPPPLEVFRKLIHFCERNRPLFRPVVHVGQY